MKKPGLLQVDNARLGVQRGLSEEVHPHVPLMVLEDQGAV
jgi:hypothetical protein